MIVKYYFIIVMANIVADTMTYSQRYHGKNKEKFLKKEKRYYE